MTENYYTQRRAELMSQLWFELKLHNKRNARARIRRIAELDYAERGIPKEQTYEELTKMYNL